jgi:hypothetical protein
MSETMSIQEGQLESGRHVSVVRAGLQAGLIGLIVMTLLGLLSIFGPQFLRPVTCGLLFVILVFVGVLAGHFLGPARTGRQGAGTGAIAGFLAAAGGAIGLAATPLDPLFNQNMEVLCAGIGGCGLFIGGIGIVASFILFFLLLAIPAIGFYCRSYIWIKKK